MWDLTQLIMSERQRIPWANAKINISKKNFSGLFWKTILIEFSLSSRWSLRVSLDALPFLSMSHKRAQPLVSKLLILISLQSLFQQQQIFCILTGWRQTAILYKWFSESFWEMMKTFWQYVKLVWFKNALVIKFKRAFQMTEGYASINKGCKVCEKFQFSCMIILGSLLYLYCDLIALSKPAVISFLKINKSNT